MAQAADPEDRDEVARPRDGLAQGVECRDARAQQRGGVDVGEVVGDAGEGLRGRHHVLGVAAVVGDARDLAVLAGDEVAATAGLAGEVAAAEPADADAVPGAPGVTPSPTASTSPATSWPGARGKALPIAPSTVRESEWQTPQACTLTRT